MAFGDLLDQAQAQPHATDHLGVAGQADLTGILPDGRRLEIEVKSDGGRQTEDQRNFQWMIERFGGVYVLARSLDDIERELRRAGYDVEAP